MAGNLLIWSATARSVGRGCRVCLLVRWQYVNHRRSQRMSLDQRIGEKKIHNRTPGAPGVDKALGATVVSKMVSIPPAVAH